MKYSMCDLICDTGTINASDKIMFEIQKKEKIRK